MTGSRRHTEPLDVHLIAVRDGTAGTEVLLSRRAGDVYATGCWHLPSGHLDGPWEDMVTALVRETHEETGVAVDPADVRAAVTVHHRSPAGGARLGVFFEVRRWHGTPQIMEPQVCDAMDWFALDRLPEPIVAYCRAGLDAYRAGARMGVHFQEPGDPIAYDPAVDRLLLVPDPGAHDATPADAVRAFAEQAVGRIVRWTDVSWARQDSRVWRAHGAEGGTWYVKVHQNERFHRREVAALRGWVAGLGEAAPRLVAADGVLRAVVLTAVGGRSLHGAAFPPEQQRKVFHRVGRLAAAIHTSAPPLPGGGAPPVRKLERHLDGARTHLAAGDEEFVRATVESAAGLPALPEVPTHGDFQPRNLRWDEHADALYVLDFERSEYGPAVRDFVRLADAWHGRPDLLAAVLNGYGRTFTPAEEAQLAVLSVLDAVSGISYGAAHGDPELVERGHRTLARLRAARQHPDHPTVTRGAAH
ncbi:NUDIX domain-containing protein [Streptomyces misionensis]|uniref:NUDIX domain-containing protein n=1 Tax=Streptomyces misionensis TaxID=67331 RepID=A0A1H5HJ37_9ACTN|nr:phosphotransferase [Streptomyces misionensis]SEE27987.1 NUDIX domain-containing protein [Streptomyces misionensis]